MYTRKDRLDDVCTHQEYYAQFVTDSVKAMVSARIGKKRIVEALETDEHLNNIPLVRWDAMTPQLFTASRLMKTLGDWLSPAGGVCILKEAARQIAKA